MAFVEPVTLRDRGVRLEPLALAHEDGLRAAAADGELWKLRITSVPEPQDTRAYIEAALKMREASQSWTESYPAMEYRHGPMSIATPGRAVWVFGEAPASLPGEVAATGATFVPSHTHPLAELARAHQVALERSRVRGLDADAPRHLTRSVILAS